MTTFNIHDVRPRVYLSQTQAGTTVFDLPFAATSANDLRIRINGEIILPDAFAITQRDDAAGVRVVFSEPPDVGARIVVWRDMTFQRTTDFLEDGLFSASALNGELDRMVMLMQQAETFAGDALRRSIVDTDVDMQIPRQAERADKFLSFDADGRPEASDSREHFAVVSENLSDVRNYGDVFLGPADSDPLTRRNGTALQNGDLYYDTVNNRLRIYDMSTQDWRTGFATDDAYLSRDGSVPIVGSLDAPALSVAGNSVWHAGNQGSGSGLDAERLDGIDGADFARTADFLDHSGRLSAMGKVLGLNALRDLIASGWTMQNMIEGFTDAFEDESGIDDTASSSRTYQSGSYAGAYIKVTQSEGNPVGTMTSGGGLSAIFNENSAQTKAQSGCTPGNSGVPNTAWAGKDWGIGLMKTMKKAACYPTSDSGFSSDTDVSVTLTLQGSDDNFEASVNDLGEIEVVDHDDSMPETIAASVQSTAYRYHRILVSAMNSLHASEIEFYDGISDMTLVSEAHPTDTQPESARVLFLAEPIDPITLNVDLIAEVSRDDGATWVAGTLAEAADYDATTAIYVTSDIDLASQPVGSIMRLRARTANTKEIRLHGWTLQWR